MKIRMRFILIVIIVAAVGTGAYWFVNRASAQEENLKASGTIETTEVTLSPEIGGRVVEVLVAKGETVKQGQVIARLDDTLWQDQLKQVRANIQALQSQQRAAQAQQEAAQANYDLLKAGAQDEQIQAAQEAVKTAGANVAAVQAQYAQIKAGARDGDIALAGAAIAQAASQLKVATDVHDKTIECVMVPGHGEVCPGLGTREEQARAAQTAAQEAYDAAVARLDQIKSGATKDELAAALARINAAQAQQDMAQAQLAQIQKGARTEQLRAAQAQINAASAQVEGIGSQIAAAEAQAQALQHQIEKLTLHAPQDGVVLRRSIEPGEVAAPGARLMTIGDIAHMTITVYVPEDRYGEIHLGQLATLQVDSFPTESFTTMVTRIADEAEFTPRNVQTAESRATTVFAIELAVQNTAGKLKSGMPADVYFGQ